MASLCESSPLKIALDEELIGVNDFEQKSKLIETIKPIYYIKTKFSWWFFWV